MTIAWSCPGLFILAIYVDVIISCDRTCLSYYIQRQYNYESHLKTIYNVQKLSC